jgi:hypothetical protein
LVKFAPVSLALEELAPATYSAGSPPPGYAVGAVFRTTQYPTRLAAPAADGVHEMFTVCVPDVVVAAALTSDGAP